MVESKRRARVGRVIRSGLISLAIALVLLGLIEGGFRLAGKIRTGTWPVTRAESATRFSETVGSAYEPHPFLVVRGRPGAHLEIGGHEVSFESHGYRGSEVVVPKPPGTYRILCSGGSTTFDLLAPDDDNTWPARLESLLGDDVDTVNAGFPGWTTAQNLISLELRDVDMSPDLVIVFAGINDLQPASHQPLARDYALGHGEILRRVLGVDSIPLRIASRFVFIEWILDEFSSQPERAGAWMPAWKWEGGDRRDVISAEAVDVFERNLRSIAAVADAHGARVLVVAQHVALHDAETDRDYLESWAPGLTARGFVQSLERYNEVASRLGAEGIVEFVDPFEDGQFTRDNFGDPMHFNASGSALFAEILARKVAAMRDVP